MVAKPVDVSLGCKKLRCFLPLVEGFLIEEILTILKVSMVTDIFKSNSKIRTFFLIVLVCT